MKTKDKKTKAQEFIKKYQLGGDYEIQNPYQYDPNFTVAQQNQIVTPPLNQLNAAKSQSAYQTQPSFLDSAIPFISPAINLGIGVANIFQSIKEKSRQKNYERAFKKDLERRQQESHFGDFYHTPYEYSYQVGGQVDNSLNQMNNQMQLFMDYYNNQEQGRQVLDQQFQDYYQQKNEQMKQSWKSKQSAGFNSLLNGAMGAIPLLQKGGTTDTIDSIKAELKNKFRDIDMEKAKALVKMSPDSTHLKNYMKIVHGADSEDLKIGFKPKKDRFREHQDGGEILNPVIDPTQDLYSPEYKVPTEVEDEVSQVQIEAKEDDTIMNWLFEDQQEEPDEINQTYFAEEGESIPETRYTGDVSNMGKSIAVSMNNPGNIKMGKFAARYGATPGRQATDGGVFAKFPDVETGLKAQRDLLLSSGYANLTVGEAMKRWSNNGYGADLYPEVANKPLYLLSDRELIELQRRQIQREDPTMYKILYKN